MSQFTRFSMRNILEQNLNRLVKVRLQNGESVRGKLRQFDEHMNLLLEVEDSKKTSFMIIRGNNVVVLCDLVFAGEVV